MAIVRRSDMASSPLLLGILAGGKDRRSDPDGIGTDKGMQIKIIRTVGDGNPDGKAGRARLNRQKSGCQPRPDSFLAQGVTAQLSPPPGSYHRFD
jgi:hypothetical protein